MRIVHVVSGLAPDQRFGGISRVALDLARQQREQGHDVHIVTSDIGFSKSRPNWVEGVRVTLLRSLHLAPAMGFGTIISPGLPLIMLRLLRRADVVHVHLAREPNTLGAAAIVEQFGTPLVLQTHGMLDAPNNALARAVDLLLTAPVLRRASVALTLTTDEDAEINRLSSGRLAATRFPNGVQLDAPRPSAVKRERVSVLFLARLHPRKGAVDFARAAVRIAPDRPDLRFDLVGPDEGDAREVRTVIGSSGSPAVRYVGAVDHAEVAGLMAEAILYCLPARDEPFGLSLLEALASETPVVLHSTAHLASEIIEAGAGWTFGPGQDDADLERALRRAVADADELVRRGRAARELAERRYGIEGVALRLGDVYRDVIESAGRRGRSRDGSSG